jgi:hypothetical protein
MRGKVELTFLLRDWFADHWQSCGEGGVQLGESTASFTAQTSAGRQCLPGSSHPPEYGASRLLQSLRIISAPMNPKKLFGELRRRNVYRAAVAYGVLAWFLTQLFHVF